MAHPSGVNPHSVYHCDSNASATRGEDRIVKATQHTLMNEHPDLTQQQFRDATNRLYQTKSAEEIQQLVSDPLFSNPILHRVWHEQINDDLARVKERIDMFFQLFAFRIHRQFFDRVERIPLDRLTPPSLRPQYRPPFFAGLMELLGTAIPKHQEYVLSPVRDCERIAVELSETIGREVSLPPYSPLAGALWNAVIVICAACRIERIEVRAYYVDLVTAPQLTSPLTEGMLNASGCPYCGEMVAFPTRVWISEEPLAPDTLFGFSGIWRAASGAMVFQTPAGTQRRPENEPAMTYRAMAMLQAYRWPSEFAGSEERLTLSIAYSDEELSRLVVPHRPG